MRVTPSPRRRVDAKLERKYRAIEAEAEMHANALEQRKQQAAHELRELRRAVALSIATHAAAAAAGAFITWACT